MSAIRTIKAVFRGLGADIQEPSCDDVYAGRAEKRNVKVETAKGAAALGLAGAGIGGVIGTLALSPEIGAPIGAAGLGWLGGWVGKASAEDYNQQLDSLQQNCPRRVK